MFNKQDTLVNVIVLFLITFLLFYTYMGKDFLVEIVGGILGGLAGAVGGIVTAKFTIKETAKKEKEKENREEYKRNLALIDNISKTEQNLSDLIQNQILFIINKEVRSCNSLINYFKNQQDFLLGKIPETDTESQLELTNDQDFEFSIIEIIDRNDLVSLFNYKKINITYLYALINKTNYLKSKNSTTVYNLYHNEYEKIENENLLNIKYTYEKYPERGTFFDMEIKRINKITSQNWNYLLNESIINTERFIIDLIKIDEFLKDILNRIK